MTISPIIRRVLISVSNKTGLISFAQRLAASGINIIATGGTASLLTQNNIHITTVSEFTGFPEILGGRVKTLHPKIHGGLLQRPGLDDSALKTHQIEPIDLLVVNLYPFQETIAQPKCSFPEAIEQIDIGGPAMLRAAAKNHTAVTVVIDPEDYDAVLAEIEKEGKTSLRTRLHLAQKVFNYTAKYDEAVATYLSNITKENKKDRLFPDNLCISSRKIMDLRYGENPHQAAALYIDSSASPHSLASASLLQGKALSYNNLLDSDTALSCVCAFDPQAPACVVVKHATPCGVAQGETLSQAYTKAVATDPISAYGGIIALNQVLDKNTAKSMIKQSFVEVILAPQVDSDALELLQTKPNIRLLVYKAEKPQAPSLTLCSIQGGLLVQQQDNLLLNSANLQTVTQRSPTTIEMLDLLFAWKVVQFVKSNAIVYAKDQSTLGIGCGQTSRIFSVQIAILKAQQAQLPLTGAVMSSDAFFPFTDSIEVAAAAGIRAIIQPGGSKHDKEIIAAANHADMAMVFTHIRHFRH